MRTPRMSPGMTLTVGLVVLLVAGLATVLLVDRSRTTDEPEAVLGPQGVSAPWVIDENRRQGDPSWRIEGASAPGRIEGFANRVYVEPGRAVTLYVSSDAPQFHVEAYRVGFYHGAGARLVWQSDEIPGRRQPPCPVTRGTNLVACDNWTPALTVPVTTAFVQGDYLFKLVGSGNQQSYVPLTVWDPDSRGTYLVKNDVFTWQAWNPYGGFDYYVGPGDCPAGGYPLCSRARVVSYDRPYGDGEGTGDFLDLELPLIRWV